MVRATFAIGLTVLLNTALFRIDTVMVSVLKDDAAVGFYGAAYRLLESPLFIAYGLVAALLPALSRATRTSRPPIGELAAVGLKLILCAMAPIGMAYALLAEPIVELVYGQDFLPAIPAVRLLGGAAALYGIGYLAAYILIAQGRQRVLPQVTAGVLAFNVIANLLLIPPLSFSGAALVTSLSELALAVAFLAITWRITGPLPLGRIVLGPLGGCAAMALVTLALGPTLVALALAPLAYLAVLAAIELRLFPEDVRRVLATLRPGRVSE
jgi:O-antigen/teichoic acid export membrane protein